MVATRRSLPNAASDYDDDDEDDMAPQQSEDRKSKRVRNALRKLHIDGTEILKGENRLGRRETIGTYHYRGAVYDITADTPQTWIDQQPMRYRLSESETRPHSRDRPVASRTLSGLQDFPAADDDEAEARPAKRTRRSMPGTLTRSRRQSHFTRSAEKAAKDRHRRLRSSRFNTDQRSDLQMKIADAREVARDKGYKVDPLEDSDMQGAKVQQSRKLTSTLICLGQVNSRYATLSATYRCMRDRGEFDSLLYPDLATTEGAKKEDGQEEKKEDEETEEVEGDDVEMDNTLEMPKPADIALQVYASPSSASQQLRDDGPPTSSESPADYGNKPFMRVDSPSLVSAKGRSPSPVSKGTEVAISIEREPGIAIDTTGVNGPGAGRASEPIEAVDQQIHDELALSVDTAPRSTDVPKPSSAPPVVCPESKPVMRSPGAASHPQSRRWSPRLSERLNDNERAEGAIHQERRQSETPQAWRRRVQRELTMLRSWPLSDALPAFAAAGGGGEAMTAVNGNA